ncbi:cysteine-rich receptor-like protein kinase 43 [Salvia miltiorrhiza]|uniref:cysteine-rich receptor-like protein kinase 43 n=1 Tax=Salvia miltiorrhiza TaxID=226208 RepID=UPI0025AB65CF|nr:cysteine-rich receptor-like protein kinase 43 [Salvia miltiorrhiza]
MTKPKNFFQNLLKPFTSSSNRDQDEEDLGRIAEREQKNFSFEALAAATKNFHPSHKLGEGGFGPVYQGKLSDGREVAVKRLSQRSAQGNKEFLNEAKLLSRVQHKNVVNLLGYSIRGEEKLLVYEYVVNQSLDKYLFKGDKRELLDWKRRHDVIVGVAKGLLYLHEQAHCTIIHRDIKGSNILLDEKWVPKIADFGMARLYPEDQTHVQTRVAGTNGYMAPEYLLHGNLSKKADIFSFGVVVLELISGQKNSTFARDPDSDSLLEWAYKLYKKQRSFEIMDPILVSSADMEQIPTLVQIGLLCVQSDPQSRPDMDRVVVLLSRKPSHLEEPRRPGVPGSRQRRYRTGTMSSATGNSEGSSSGSFGSTNTQSASTTATATTSSSLANTRLHRHGKRPI